MPKLTAIQLTQIAENLVSIARMLGDYIIRHQLSVKGRLGKLHAAILEEASKLYQLSALEVGKEVQLSVETLDELTNELQETFQDLNDLKLMINLATSVLSISTAMAGGDLKGFVQAVKDLRLSLYPEDE